MRAHLYEEGGHIREHEHERDLLWRDKQMCVAFEPARHPTKQDVFCSDEATRRECDEEIFHNVDTVALWISV